MSTKSGSGWAQLPMAYRTRMREAMFAKYGTVCHLKLKGCTYTATEADHVGLARLHGHGLDNLRPACRACNNRKGEPKDDTDPQPLPSGWA